MHYTEHMTMTQSILSVYDRASVADIANGMAWYSDAHMIAREAGNIHTGAAIIAALSPRMPWHRNIELARVAFNDVRMFRGALGNSIRKVNAILDGGNPLELLKTPKTRSFYDNIVNPLTSMEVTVDVHAIHVAGIDKDSVNLGEYRAIADAYREAARYVGISALDLQAVTWLTYRREIEVWTQLKDVIVWDGMSNTANVISYAME